MNPPLAKVPRIDRGDENPAASSLTQPPAEPGGKDATSGQSEAWKPSLRDPPVLLTQLTRPNIVSPSPADPSRQKAEPPAKAPPAWVRDQGAPQHAIGSAAGDQSVKAKSPVEGAKAAGEKATSAEDAVPARRGGDDKSGIPKATPPAQPDGDISSEDSPTLVGSDEITTIPMILKEISTLRFSRPRARKVLRNEKDFFHIWRDPRATWSQEPDDLEE
eukprot:4838722-Pyramimonas_sp.AAC.1